MRARPSHWLIVACLVSAAVLLFTGGLLTGLWLQLRVDPAVVAQGAKPVTPAAPLPSRPTVTIPAVQAPAATVQVPAVQSALPKVDGATAATDAVRATMPSAAPLAVSATVAAAKNTPASDEKVAQEQAAPAPDGKVEGEQAATRPAKGDGGKGESIAAPDATTPPATGVQHAMLAPPLRVSAAPAKPISLAPPAPTGGNAGSGPDEGTKGETLTAANAAAAPGSDAVAGAAVPATVFPVEAEPNEAAQAAAVLQTFRAGNNGAGNAAAFTTEVAIFSERQNAAALQEKLERAGFPAFIVAQQEPSRAPWYSVVVGRHDTREAAARTAEELRRRMSLEGRLMLLLPADRPSEDAPSAAGR